MPIENNAPAVTSITTHLRNMKYPADRDALLRCAEESGAQAEALAALRRVEDRIYGGVAEVSQSLERALAKPGTLSAEGRRVDEASEESFPASDPPASMSSARHIGKPPKDRKKQGGS